MIQFRFQTIVVPSFVSGYSSMEVDEIVSYMLNHDIQSFGPMQRIITELLEVPMITKEQRKKITEAVRIIKNDKCCMERVAECSSSDQPSQQNILIYTAYSDDYKIGFLCEHINREYATRHGYLFQSFVLSSAEMTESILPRGLSWYKMYILQDLFSDAKAEYLKANNIEYIMWIDADAIVVHQDVRLETLIQTSGQRDLILAVWCNALRVFIPMYIVYSIY